MTMWAMFIAYSIIIMMFLIAFPIALWKQHQKKREFKDAIHQFLHKDEILDLNDIINIRDALDLSEYSSRKIIKSLYLDISKHQTINLEKVRALQNAIEKEEPFEGCPNELKPSLIEIRQIIKKHNPENSELLLPVVKDLKEFNKMQQEYSKIKWQNKMAFWFTIFGFFLSLIGLIYGVTTTPSSDEIAKSVIQKMNSK